MNGNWFYTKAYAVYGNGGKATQRSPPDNLTRWIIILKALREKALER